MIWYAWLALVCVDKYLSNAELVDFGPAPYLHLAPSISEYIHRSLQLGRTQAFAFWSITVWLVALGIPCS
jgi:hypothetical protein